MAEERTQKKRGRRVFAGLVLALAIAILAVVFALVFYVRNIEVEWNEYTDGGEILEYVQQDPLSANSVYLLLKYKLNGYDRPGSISSIGVSLKNPWTVKVKVKEKTIIGYIGDEGEYDFFDKEGVVVLISSEKVREVPRIEGIDVSRAELYEPLKVESKKLLEAILDVAKEVKNYELTPDRIVCNDEGVELYFGEIRVMLGTSVTAEKMAQIAPILSKLAGRTGTLHLEHFDSSSGTITFTAESPEEETEQEQTEEVIEPADTDASYEEDSDWEDSYEDDYDEEEDGGSLYDGYTLDEDGYYYGADGYYGPDGTFYEY